MTDQVVTVHNYGTHTKNTTRSVMLINLQDKIVHIYSGQVQC